MHWSETEEILGDDDTDPHLTHSIPQYRKIRPQVSKIFPETSTTIALLAFASGGVALGFVLSRAIYR